MKRYFIRYENLLDNKKDSCLVLMQEDEINTGNIDAFKRKVIKYSNLEADVKDIDILTINKL